MIILDTEIEVADLDPQENKLSLIEKLFVKLFNNAIRRIVKNIMKEELDTIYKHLDNIERRFNNSSNLTNELTQNLQIVGKGLRGVYGILEQIVAINSRF